MIYEWCKWIADIKLLCLVKTLKVNFSKWNVLEVCVGLNAIKTITTYNSTYMTSQNIKFTIKERQIQTINYT